MEKSIRTLLNFASKSSVMMDWAITFNTRTLPSLLRTNGILRGNVLEIEDFFRGTVKQMELFGGETLILKKIFRGT